MKSFLTVFMFGVLLNCGAQIKFIKAKGETSMPRGTIWFHYKGGAGDQLLKKGRACTASLNILADTTSDGKPKALLTYSAVGHSDFTLVNCSIDAMVKNSNAHGQYTFILEPNAYNIRLIKVAYNYAEPQSSMFSIGFGLDNGKPDYTLMLGGTLELTNLIVTTI